MAHEVSIFLENKIGHFERITRVLKENNINIRTMSITDTANGWGILNLLVNNPKEAYTALSDKGISVALRKVVALEMKDEAGGLSDLLMKVSEAKVNFNNAYGRILPETQSAILVIDVPDYRQTIKKLKTCGIAIMPDEKVYGNLKT